MMRKVLWLKDVAKEDTLIAGGKGAQLGELKKSGFPVPDGFVIPTDVYNTVLDEAHLRSSTIQEYLSGLDAENTKTLQEASEKLQSLIISASISQNIEKEILEAYDQLGSGLVAVRSSATAEDLKNASFAGQQETFLNIKGKEALLDAVKKCMASLFTARAIYYRDQNKVDHSTVSIAVVVQQMVQAQKAGVLFTINPVTNNEDEVVIEAAEGSAETVVGGKGRPDNYVVSKASKKIKVRRVAGAHSILSDSEIEQLTKIGKAIETHYKFPQDIEWAIDKKGGIHILQARPITTFQKTEGRPNWKKILSREYGVQYTEVSLRSLSPENRFIVPEPFYDQVYIPEDNNETCYIDESKWNTFVGALRERYLEHPENYEEFERLFRETGSRYVELAKQISQQNLREKNNQELKELYLAYQEKSLRYAPFIWIQFIINNFFADKAKEILAAKLGEDNKNLYDAYEVALKPHQKAAVHQLSEFALHWQDLGEAEKDRAFANFQWMPCLDIHNRPWTKDEFSSRLGEFQQQKKEVSLAYEDLLKQIGASPEEKQILDTAKRLAYLKDLKDDFRRQGVFYGQALFKELASRTGVRLEDISYMLETEILEFLDGKGLVSQKTIQERRKGFVIFFAEKETVTCKSGEDIEAMLRELGIPTLGELSADIKGIPASPGQAKGKVTIVRGVADLPKVRKGDILVAVVTHPDYIPAMQKAVAIITDEGGITSHVAIVSRELKIPSIVGTEHATKILRDGDMIEVDATAGLVRRVED